MSPLSLGNASFLLLKGTGIACVLGGLGAATWCLVATRDGLIQRAWARHCSSIERRLYRLFVFRPGYQFAVGQLVAMVICSAICIAVGAPFPAFLLVLLLCAAAPELWLRRLVRQRVAAIEAQIDTFLVALANALKATPSVADALVSTQSLVADPLRQELQLAVKQMRVGSTMEQALLNMSGRVGSRQLDSAISAILIGRQVGGNIAAILDATAGSMREMSRLEGVVRSKTAEGKSQMWVLGGFPIGILVMFNLVSPGFFDPLTSSPAGYFCTMLALLLWGLAIVTARAILKTDI